MTPCGSSRAHDIFLHLFVLTPCLFVVVGRLVSLTIRKIKSLLIHSWEIIVLVNIIFYWRISSNFLVGGPLGGKLLIYCRCSFSVLFIIKIGINLISVHYSKTIMRVLPTCNLWHTWNTCQYLLILFSLRLPSLLLATRVVRFLSGLQPSEGWDYLVYRLFDRIQIELGALLI